ncbi:hypothetical protein D3C87_1541670 [compost metagenome]
MPIGELSLFFLQAATVQQQDFHQLTGGGRGVHRAAITIAHQYGQVSAVVEMGMGQDNGIEFAHRKLERVPIVQSQLLVSLEQSAIDQHMLVAMFQQVLAARNRARGT